MRRTKQYFNTCIALIYLFIYLGLLINVVSSSEYTTLNDRMTNN
jgi:hypothetical protein